MRAETIKGHLDLLLLAVVGDGPVHGYAVIAALREKSGGALRLPEGTVYPALHRLEAAGLLGSGWASVEGRRRRVYELTGEGRTALAGARRDWEAFSAAVRCVITGPSPAPDPA